MATLAGRLPFSRARGRGVLDVQLDASLSVPLVNTQAARRVDLPTACGEQGLAQRLIRLPKRHCVEARTVTTA